MIFAESNGEFEEKTEWFRSFYYEQENRRGLDDTEDLGCPGEFHFDLENDDAVLLLAANQRFSEQFGKSGSSAQEVYDSVHVVEMQRRRAMSPLERSAESYVIRRGSGSTIIAGYPWFTDWGRDTFIAIRGVCLAINNIVVARQILVGWADTVSEGMILNPPYANTKTDKLVRRVVTLQPCVFLIQREGKQGNAIGTARPYT